jgi:hypothetical protein
VGLTATVTVVKVVPPQTIAALELATATLATDEAATELAAIAVSLEAVLELADVPRVEAATLVPSTATAVKLEKP